VDVADDVATIEILSTIYQMGYRVAALVGGALALFMAERLGWPAVYAWMGAIMLAVAFASLFAPDSRETVESSRADALGLAELRQPGELTPRVRAMALGAVGVLWAWALITVGVFMVRSLGGDPENRPDSVAFIAGQGPLIVLATVVVPALIAAWLVRQKRLGRHVLPVPVQSDGWRDAVLDHGYRALILPLADIIGRLRWAAILVLGLVLTYRLTDSIWGSFAFPFYLGELQYSKDEVAVASKFFGVGALMAGLMLGGILFTWLGCMSVLTIGAITAALTNLLYADLARGGELMQRVSDSSGFTYLITHLGADERMGRLMVAIAGENIAGGLAGAAFVAYLSSIVSKRYSAVQYALLSSLTLLMGTLGRGALGRMIEVQGYFTVFLFTTALGGIAVLLCLVEWWRTGRKGDDSGARADQPAPA